MFQILADAQQEVPDWLQGMTGYVGTDSGSANNFQASVSVIIFVAQRLFSFVFLSDQ